MTGKDSWFQRYLLPGFVFQSVIIAGAYGSGRELEQFFLHSGPIGGLLGMAVTTCVFSVVLMATFEFSRTFRVYDYRSFFKALLGKAWIIYELLYVLMMILVISIISAAAGDILRDAFGIAPLVGNAGIMLLIAALVFFGTRAVERFLAMWSFVLYATYLTFLGLHLAQNGDQILANMTSGTVNPGWLQSGIAFSGYNLAAIPAILFCLRHQQTRREALSAGFFGGIIAMLPGILFFVAMIGQFDTLIAEGDAGRLPVTILIGALEGAGFFLYLFPIVLFGTFVETGAALIHGVNERIDQTFAEHGVQMPQWMRPAVAAAILVVAVLLADAIGLTGLVARGYGSITWAFLLVYIVPVLTYGVWLILRRSPQ
ncbi:MAG: hypothetical protein R3192_06370 [Woeseiaceae bacterium]|nr:hypothetical protein [Woeseiaceae bacterium]